MNTQPNPTTGEHSEPCQSGFPDYDCPTCGSALKAKLNPATTGVELAKPYAHGECESVIDKRPFSRSLNPTTGEWTARKAPTGYISALYEGNTEIYRQSLDCLEDLQRVADAHNAALAKVKEKL